MRILHVCTALCIAWPTTALASTDILPTTTAFAYHSRHSASLLSPAAFSALRPSETAPEMPEVKEDDKPAVDADALAPITRDHKIRPVFSRTELCTAAASAAEAQNLPASFFTNLIQQESGFKPHAISPAGAQGIAQFMPRVAAAYGLSNPFDPIHALAVSARFLRELFQQFGNLGLAAAAYNGGSGRVGNWLAKKGKLPDETRAYVRNITGRPAEYWVSAKARAEAVTLPPHARCPGMNVIEARVIPPASGGPIVDVAAAPPASRYMLAAGPNGKKSPVVIASRGGKKIVIIGGDRDGRKPAAASKASDKKLAAEKKPNLRIAVAEKAPAKAGKAKPAQKTAAREAGTKAEKATKTPAKAANAKPAPGKRVKVAEAR